jgi:hypothetical protein
MAVLDGATILIFRVMVRFWKKPYPVHFVGTFQEFITLSQYHKYYAVVYNIELLLKSSHEKWKNHKKTAENKIT